MTREEYMESKGWWFFQTGPNEGEWLLFTPKGALHARQGDPLWRAHLMQFDPMVEPPAWWDYIKMLKTLAFWVLVITILLGITVTFAQ